MKRAYNFIDIFNLAIFVISFRYFVFDFKSETATYEPCFGVCLRLFFGLSVKELVFHEVYYQFLKYLIWPYMKERK